MNVGIKSMISLKQHSIYKYFVLLANAPEGMK